MQHYTSAKAVKALAIRLVATQVAAGQRRITNRKQFRIAILDVAHSAAIGVL